MPQFKIQNSKFKIPQSALVVGSGPNGLAAAITLARVGVGVRVLEAAESIGGGCRSSELTLPGFTHDVCSAIHPLGAGSPFFRTLPLGRYGLEWIHPPAPLAHPLDDGTAVLLYRSLRATAAAANLGEKDGRAYLRTFGPLVRSWAALQDSLLGPRPFSLSNLVPLARFGLLALLPARLLAGLTFKGERARALFAGMAAHSILPLERSPSAAFGLVLGILGHTSGWPVARGGSQAIADAMAAYLRDLGGEIITGSEVTSLDNHPTTDAVLFDTGPLAMAKIARNHLPRRYRESLSRYRYGPGVFKVDYALDGPVPWRARDCNLAATLHLGGTLEEIAASESAVWRGKHPQRPFVLAAQQSLFDPTRAPKGKHTLWAYCHVPNNSTFDMTERIEDQIERFAPGFRDRILARHTCSAREMHAYNPNYIGGDINGGAQILRQLFTRPLPRWDPYSTPSARLFLCSSSTPPGGGVHGMCGYHAARSVLRAFK